MPSNYYLEVLESLLIREAGQMTNPARDKVYQMTNELIDEGYLLSVALAKALNRFHPHPVSRWCSKEARRISFEAEGR